MFKHVTEKQNGKKTEFTVQLSCDICGNNIIKIVQRARASALMNSSRHFCNHACYAVSRKRGGLSYRLSQETCREKYNAPHHMKSPEFKKKFDDLLEEKYGVRNAMQTDKCRSALSERMNKHEVKERLRENWINDNPAKRPEIKEKIVESLKKWAQSTHGVDNISQVKEIYEKGRQTCIARYGNSHPIRLLEVEKKRQATCLEKYGATNPFGSKQLRDKWSYEKWGMSWDERNESLPEYEKYTRAVWQVTKQQQLESLLDYEKRGKDFHLDHKFSIAEGYRQGITPEIIGNIINLRIITAFENTSKSDGCSIDKDALLLEYTARKLNQQ